MFQLGDHVRMVDSEFSIIAYGRIYSDQGNGYFYVMPYTEGLCFMAHKNELELIASSTVGVELFASCPHHCSNGCYCCYMPGRDSMNARVQQMTLRSFLEA